MPEMELVARIAIGAAMFVAGILPDEGWTRSLERALIGNYSSEVQTALHRVSAALLMVCGAGICATAII